MTDLQRFYRRLETWSLNGDRARVSVRLPELRAAAGAIADLSAALEKIVAMNVQYCLDRYGDASKAETMGCVVTAREALSKARSHPIIKEEGE